MSKPEDAPIDELAVVYGWMQRLSTDQATAEEWTLETLRRYYSHHCPEWLQRCNVMLRLQYLTARVVLERSDAQQGGVRRPDEQWGEEVTATA